MNKLTTKAIISKLTQQILAGTADTLPNQSQASFGEDTQDDLNLDELKLDSTDLSININEIFQFLKDKKFAQDMQIVNSEGLIIAEVGDNSKLESLAATFPQYHQMLEFADMNTYSSGFWIKLEKKYSITIVEEVSGLSYGLFMQCEQLLSSKQIEKIKTLLKAVIKKGVYYE